MISTSSAPVKGFRVILPPAKGTPEAKAFAKHLNAILVDNIGLEWTERESSAFPGLVVRRCGQRFSFSYPVKGGRVLEVAYTLWGEVAVQTGSVGAKFASFPPKVQAHVDATLAAYAAKMTSEAA